MQASLPHASLPMYDFPAIRGATDRYWQAIRSALGQGPRELVRDGDVWRGWQDPDLLLSQTCGLPFRSRLKGKVALVGTPDFGLPGCGPGEYNSVFVARKDDPRNDLTDFEGAKFAVNEFGSQSGWAAPIMYTRSQNVAFGGFLETGAHIASAEAVAEGRADIAALDGVSWRFLGAEGTLSRKLKAIDITPPSPGLPYITSLKNDPAQIFAAVEQAIASLSQADREALGLKGLVWIAPDRYTAVPTPAQPGILL
ncbi:MAG: PhnD/SsuA/transferrin family substrate-binding protein [Pseudomonadota bacterium]